MAKTKVAIAQELNEAPAQYVPVEAPKAPKAPKVDKTYQFVRDLETGQKFAPQAVIILNTLKEHNSMLRSELETALAANTSFKTRQPVGRIISYYEKDLINSGAIKLAA